MEGIGKRDMVWFKPKHTDDDESAHDRRMDELVEDHDLVPQARAATFRTGSQIDNWLVDSELDAHMMRSDTIPGVCGKDHMAVVMNYLPGISAITDRVERQP